MLLNVSAVQNIVRQPACSAVMHGGRIVIVIISVTDLQERSEPVRIGHIRTPGVLEPELSWNTFTNGIQEAAVADKMSATG